MSEMVYRVAKVMAKQDALGATADGPGIQRQGWQAYMPMARAAIEAMREPTEGMIENGKGAKVNGEVWSTDIPIIYRDMIDAALASEKRGSDVDLPQAAAQPLEEQQPGATFTRERS